MVSFKQHLLAFQLAAAGIVGAQNTTSPGSAACSALASSLTLENTTVKFVSYHTAGSNLAFDVPTCPQSQVVPVDLCRVALYVATTERSGISLETWLPSNWTGRTLMTGNGGLNGCLDYMAMAYGASAGFAAFGQNGGHNGTSGLPFFQNEDIVADFVYRGIHTGVTVGKEVTNQYYPTDFTKSYYLGCSTGGRQGFKSVQDFPEDFDGVIAGAPALYFPALTSWSGTFFSYLGPANSSTFVTRAQWSLVHQEILRQCDSIDGVADGILETTELCDFRPEALLCAGGTTNTTSCLTSAQVGAVRKVFSPYYGVDGQLIYPRMQPGSEDGAVFVYYNGQPFPFTTDWFRYVVFQDPNWDPTTFDLEDTQAAIEQNPFNAESAKGDLSAFRDAGGKVLHWHGLADNVITSENSARYYNQVSREMDLPSSSLDDFYRYFRVSGTGHCMGGVGASDVGQQSAGGSTDAQHNILTRIVAWVEEGSAPETITGVKYVNDDAAQGVDFERNHCRYPLRNVCVDPDNYRRPEAWKCI